MLTLLLHSQFMSLFFSAFKITNKENSNYVLLYSDEGYATKSWKEMNVSGIMDNKKECMKTLEQIREKT